MSLSRPSYSSIAASLALFVSLGGTSYAVAQLEPNSVQTQHLADAAVTSPKVANGAIGNADLGNDSVSSARVIDGSIAKADLAGNSVDAGKVVDGSLGTADLAPIPAFKGTFSKQLTANQESFVELSTSYSQQGLAMAQGSAWNVRLPEAGIYLVTARVVYSGSGGTRTASLFHTEPHGGTRISSDRTTENEQTTSATVRASAGDLVTLGLKSLAAGNGSGWISVTRIGGR